MDFPDSPESVALMLLCMIVSREKCDGATDWRLARTYLLDLFVECLMAVRAERDRNGRAH